MAILFFSNNLFCSNLSMHQKTTANYFLVYSRNQTICMDKETIKYIE